MLYQLGKALLGPLLLLQGHYVRRVTPRLPDPAGHQQGLSGSGNRLRLLIAGDSAAVGVGTETQRQALSGRLVAALSPSFEVEWQLLAQSGHTSAQLLDTLHCSPARAVDIVVISIGVNDVTAQTANHHWRRNIRALVKLLRHKFQARLIIFSELPPMHRFPALPQPLRWWLGLRAQQLTRRLAALVDHEPGCVLISAEFGHQPDVVASDGFHPGARAYQQWAGALSRTIHRHWPRSAESREPGA